MTAQAEHFAYVSAVKTKKTGDVMYVSEIFNTTMDEVRSNSDKWRNKFATHVGADKLGNVNSFDKRSVLEDQIQKQVDYHNSAEHRKGRYIKTKWYP